MRDVLAIQQGIVAVRGDSVSTKQAIKVILLFYINNMFIIFTLLVLLLVANDELAKFDFLHFNFFLHWKIRTSHLIRRLPYKFSRFKEDVERMIS